MRRLRELALTVARDSAAIEMPDVIEARDDLVRRFVKAAVPAVATGPSRSRSLDGDDDDAPIYWEPAARRRRARSGKRGPNPLGPLLAGSSCP